MSHRLSAPASPPSVSSAPHRAPLVSFGRRRHAPLFYREDVFTPSAPSAPASVRLSVDDRPCDNLSPDAYSRSADFLASFTKQPSSQAAKRRAQAYKTMSLPEVQAAVRCALQSSNWSLDYVSRAALSLCRGLSMGDESIIAIRELCRRGEEPASFGLPVVPLAHA